MIYFYCALISLAANVVFFVSLLAFARWALPRYGMNVMRQAMTPRFPSTTLPFKEPPHTH